MSDDDATESMKKVGLSLPAQLVERIDALADAEHRSRSNTILVLLERALATETKRAG